MDGFIFYKLLIKNNIDITFIIIPNLVEQSNVFITEPKHYLSLKNKFYEKDIITLRIFSDRPVGIQNRKDKCPADRDNCYRQFRNL